MTGGFDVEETHLETAGDLSCWRAWSAPTEETMPTLLGEEGRRVAVLEGA